MYAFLLFTHMAFGTPTSPLLGSLLLSCGAASDVSFVSPRPSVFSSSLRVPLGSPCWIVRSLRAASIRVCWCSTSDTGTVLVPGQPRQCLLGQQVCCISMPCLWVSCFPAWNFLSSLSCSFGFLYSSIRRCSVNLLLPLCCVPLHPCMS